MNEACYGQAFCELKYSSVIPFILGEGSKKSSLIARMNKIISF